MTGRNIDESETFQKERNLFELYRLFFAAANIIVEELCTQAEIDVLLENFRKMIDQHCSKDLGFLYWVRGGMTVREFLKTHDVSTRLHNCLSYNLNELLIRDLVLLKPNQIMRECRQLGKKTLKELKDCLEEYGLKLGMTRAELERVLTP